MAIVAYRTNDLQRTEPMRVDVVDESAGASVHWSWHPTRDGHACAQFSYFYGYVENCYDPRRYLVRGEGSSEDAQWLDAWEWLCEIPLVIRETEITADIAGDYDEDFGTWNESGNRLDTESVMLFPVTVGLLFDRCDR